ncbi:gamma-glutamylaminecyclotransferase isoform X4 [Mauremys reevesii]|uniref:gamma-glutamylaminecyclotransferase isoform X4 n=1 Tax=Mauremys reevesii TaxID=260615 RepID=UPI0019401879|nr:gamma-glutamylaminecyclotransferase isoform X4 [Mauremys reevesii]
MLQWIKHKIRNKVLHPCSRTNSGRMARVFVYGTLKKGQPNYQHMINGTHGRARFQGRGRTVEKYPLVIAGKYNIPFLLNIPGTGHHVTGEIYSVDDQMLQFLDEFEGCPDMYQRTPGDLCHSRERGAAGERLQGLFWKPCDDHQR